MRDHRQPSRRNRALCWAIALATLAGAAPAKPDPAARKDTGFTVIFDQNHDDFSSKDIFPRLCGDIPKAGTYCAADTRLGKDALGLFRANLARPASPWVQDNSLDRFDAPYVDTTFGQRVSRYRFKRGTEANPAIQLPTAPPSLIAVYAAPDGKRNAVSIFLNDNDGLDYGGGARSLTGNLNFQNAELTKPFPSPRHALRLRVDVWPKWSFRYPNPPNDLRTIARNPGDFPSVQISSAILFRDSSTGRTFYYNLVNYDENRVTQETVMMDTYEGIPIVQVALSRQPDGTLGSQYAKPLPDNGGPTLLRTSAGYQRFSVELTGALFGQVLQRINATTAAKRLGKPLSEEPADYQVVNAGTGGEIGHPVAGRGVCSPERCVAKLGFSVKNFQLSYGK